MDSPIYQTYLAFATGAATLKSKRIYKKPASPSKKRTLVTIVEENLNLLRKLYLPRNLLLKDSLLVYESKTLLVCLCQRRRHQLRISKEANKIQNIHQVGGSSKGADFKSDVLDEPKDEDKGYREMTNTETVDAEHENVIQESADVKELKDVDNSIKVISTIQSEFPKAVKEYLGSSLDDAMYKNTTLFKTMTKSESFNKSPKQRALYHALMESMLEDKDAMDEGVAEKLKKRKPDDVDKDEGPFAESDRGLKRQKTNKDTKTSKKAKPTESSKGTSKSHLKSTGKSAQAEEIVFKVGDTQGLQNLRKDTCNTDEPLVVNVDPKYWFKKPERPPTPDLEWNKGKSVENKPTQKWLSDLAKAKKPSRTFDDMKSTPIDFSAFVMNSLVSKHDVYSIKRILVVTNVKVKEWYGYGHLEEIEVRRSDQQLYKFMEGDFP
nr:hypothetical protein [Tanacetum cinerariifolium]